MSVARLSRADIDDVIGSRAARRSIGLWRMRDELRGTDGVASDETRRNVEIILLYMRYPVFGIDCVSFLVPVHTSFHLSICFMICSFPLMQMVSANDATSFTWIPLYLGTLL